MRYAKSDVDAVLGAERAYLFSLMDRRADPVQIVAELEPLAAELDEKMAARMKEVEEIRDAALLREATRPRLGRLLSGVSRDARTTAPGTSTAPHQPASPQGHETSS